MLPHPITGLVAATHTPFHSDGSLNLAVVETQAAHLLANGVNRAFIGGTTGESHSLSLAERRALTERWMDVTKGSDLKVIVHVGANCLGDVRDLAAQAQALGAEAISALTPSYFKPRDVGGFP
jgi:N-acetylneuraminate lyase